MRIGTAAQDLPLDTLIWKLIRVLPPSLTSLLESISDSEDYADFLTVVAMVLPEELSTITLLGSASDRMVHFGNCFERRYFPIIWDAAEAWGDDADYRDLWVSGIPIIYQGFDAEEYHDPGNLRTGMMLMGALRIRDIGQYYGVDLSTAWYESAWSHVDQADLLRIPPNGWSDDDLHIALDGSIYEGAAHYGAYMSNDTGNPFLDCWAEYPFREDWSLEAVEILTAQFLTSEVIWAQMIQMAEWLEAEPRGRFHELITFILDHSVEDTELAEEPEVSSLADVFRIQGEEEL